MRNFQQKNKKWFYSKPVLVFMFVFLLFLIVGVFKLNQKMLNNRENRKKTEVYVSDLENRKERLVSEIENLNTEEGKEKMFRENLGLAKEGEGVIVIVEEEAILDINTNKKGILPFIRNIFSKDR